MPRIAPIAQREKKTTSQVASNRTWQRKAMPRIAPIAQHEKKTTSQVALNRTRQRKAMPRIAPIAQREKKTTSQVALNRTRQRKAMPRIAPIAQREKRPRTRLYQPKVVQTLDTKTTQRNSLTKADKYPTLHFSSFNCCLGVVFVVWKRSLPRKFACCAVTINTF